MATQRHTYILYGRSVSKYHTQHPLTHITVGHISRPVPIYAYSAGVAIICAWSSLSVNNRLIEQIDLSITDSIIASEMENQFALTCSGASRGLQLVTLSRCIRVPFPTRIAPSNDK